MLKPRSNTGKPGGPEIVPRHSCYDTAQDFRKLARMYRAVTRQIEVTVEPNFLPERSSVDRGQYFWSYTIVITNTGAETVQSAPALDHHDATGHKQEVRGEGVVASSPCSRRASASNTPPACRCDRVGLHGRALTRWSAKAASGFEIDVPTFSLDSPDNRRVLN